MKKLMAAWAAAIAACAWPGVLATHHSLARFDTTTPVWVKGTVIRFDRVAPHAFIYVEQKNGAQAQRWAIDGPAPNALNRMGIAEDFLKPGDEVEVCGFPLKAEFEAQAAAAVSAKPSSTCSDPSCTQSVVCSTKPRPVSTGPPACMRMMRLGGVGSMPSWRSSDSKLSPSSGLLITMPIAPSEECAQT